MSDVGEILRRCEGADGGMELLAGCAHGKGPNWTSDATNVVEPRGRGDRRRERVYPSWRRDRRDVLGAIEALRSELGQLREQVRALRAVVQGRADTAAARERLLWIRGRLGLHQDI